MDHIDEIFKDFVDNGDGCLSIAEFSKMMGLDQTDGLKLRKKKLANLHTI